MGDDTTQQVVTKLDGTETPRFLLSLDTGEFELPIEDSVAIYSLCSNHHLTENDEYTYQRKNTTSSAYVLAKVTIESNDKVCSYCSGRIQHKPRFELYQIQTLVGLFHEHCLSELVTDFESAFMKYPHLVVPSVV